MIPRLVVAAMVGIAGVASWFLPALAEPGVQATIWSEAGVAKLPSSFEAPPLNLGDLSGNSVDLLEFRGRLVMLYFWATW